MPKTFTQVVHPYNDDPFTGHLATPISASDFTKAFIGNLPAYRRGLAPILRGLEVGMAHGYFLIGPWIVLGPLRDSEYASLGGLISALGTILIATACLASYGIVAFHDKHIQTKDAMQPADRWNQSSDGWSQFAAGFFIGGMGGAFFAYFLLQNLDTVTGILSGIFN
ncbi:MAG: photosystem I reaction center protein subunit XI [Xenococcaceae cyanobacterium]